MANMTKTKWIQLAVIAVVGVVIAVLPCPAGIERVGMVFAGVFIATLGLLVFQVVPDWLASVFAIVACGALGICTIPEALGGFSTDIFLVLVGGFLFAGALGSNNAMKRVALKIMQLFPGTEKYRGQVLASMITGTIMSPLFPDLIARIGIMGSVTQNINDAVGTEKKSKKALGLFFGVFIPCYILGNAFMSGHVNPLVLMSFMTDDMSQGVLNWTGWFSMTWPWFVILLIGTFIFSAFVCAPKGEEAEATLSKEVFKEQYEELGEMTGQEKLTLACVVFLVVALLTTSITGLSASMIFIFADIILFLGGVLKPNDIAEKVPWNMMFFVCMLLAIPAYISALGWGTLISNLLSPIMGPFGTNIWFMLPMIMILTVLLRFVVVSQLATLAIILAIFTPFLGDAGVSLAVVCWAVYMIGNSWHLPAQNPLAMAAFSMNGDYVDQSAFCKTSWIYVGMTFIAMMASIPVWHLAGLC